MQDRHEEGCGYRLESHEVLWGHLLGRLKRGRDNRSFTTIDVNRVGSQLEAGRSPATKTFAMAQGLVATFNAVAGCVHPVPGNCMFCIPLRLFLDGYALIGNFSAGPEDSGEEWAAKKEICSL